MRMKRLNSRLLFCSTPSTVLPRTHNALRLDASCGLSQVVPGLNRGLSQVSCQVLVPRWISKIALRRHFPQISQSRCRA